MARPIKPATAADVEAVGIACAMLREARNLLTRAGASRSADRVRRALKSAEGAGRHVAHRRRRTGGGNV